MTYFQLRKHEPDPEPDEVDEEEAEAEDEPEDEPQPATKKPQPTGWPGAIWCGMRGPWRWIAGHFGGYGVTIAWTIHIGSPWAFCYYRGWVAVGLALGWPMAFLLFVPREFKDRASAAIERLHTRSPKTALLAEEKRPESTPEEVYAATLQWVRGQVGDSNGIHLSDLLAHAHAHNLHTDLDVTAFRAVLERWGFPIRQQLKVGGKNRPGIHRDDLPKQPLPDPSPEESGSATTSAAYSI